MTDDFPDELTCLAHMNEVRVRKCPYESAEDSQQRKFPCQDYGAGELIRAREAESKTK